MRTLQIISLNHLDVDATTREHFHNYSDLLMSRILADDQIYGIVYVHTCNRVELILEADKEVAKRVWKSWCGLAETKDAQVAQKITQGVLACQRYLLQVAMGMRSAVLGDDQILAQLKKSFEVARHQGQLSTLLERSYQGIMQCHKEICRDTRYKQQGTSLAYHTLKEIKNHFDGDLSSKHLLIIGGGDMALQVVKYVDKFAFDKVTITNRTLEKAERLAHDHNVEVLASSELSERYDAVISCIPNGAQYLNNTNVGVYADLAAVHHAEGLDANKVILLNEMQHKLAEMRTYQIGDLTIVRKILCYHATKYLHWAMAWKARRNMSMA